MWNIINLSKQSFMIIFKVNKRYLLNQILYWSGLSPRLYILKKYFFCFHLLSNNIFSLLLDFLHSFLIKLKLRSNWLDGISQLKERVKIHETKEIMKLEFDIFLLNCPNLSSSFIISIKLTLLVSIFSTYPRISLKTKYFVNINVENLFLAMFTSNLLDLVKVMAGILNLTINQFAHLLGNLRIFFLCSLQDRAWASVDIWEKQVYVLQQKRLI